MTVEPVPEQPEYIALVVCSECSWSQSATATTQLGHLDNSENLDIELARHKNARHPEPKENSNAS